MRRILSFLLILACLAGIVPCVVTAEDTEPSLTVIGSTIKNDKNYFELTMQVTPGSKGFFSAGMVLWYDKSIMRPAAWGNGADVLPMSACTDWRNVASIPAVCPTEMSGKTAFAYEKSNSGIQPTASPAATTSPEATPGTEPTAEPAETPDAPVVRRNIGRRDTDSGTEETPLPEVTVSPETTASPEETALPEVSASPVPSTPEPVQPGDGYLYISSESALPVRSLPNNGRVVTVRFKYAGDTPEAMAASKQTIIDKFENANNPAKTDRIIDLAPDNIAAASPAGQVVFVGAGDPEDDVTEYYYLNGTTSETTEGTKHDVLLSKAPNFVLEKDVQSANTGGGSNPADFAALVFFDWDESTLLGSLVVDGKAEQSEIIKQTNDFALTLMAPDNDGNKPSMGDTWADTDAKNCTIYNPELGDDGKARYPLSNKQGYTFGKWVEFDSDAFTIYGKSVHPTEGNDMVEIAPPDSPTYSNISGGLVLKAAYTANTVMDSLTSSAQRGYVISNNSAPDAGYYGRYGTSANYSLKFKVERKNSENHPVQRPRTTALRVIVKVGDSELYSLINMKNIDNQIVEVAAPGNADSVSVSVIDIGGVSDWVSRSAARSDVFQLKSIQEGDNLGYVIYGTVNYINQEIAENGATTFGAGIYNNANLTVSKGNVHGATSTGATALRKQAATNIREGQQQKLAAEGILYLSWQEMRNAIKNGNYADSTP